MHMGFDRAPLKTGQVSAREYGIKRIFWALTSTVFMIGTRTWALVFKAASFEKNDPIKTGMDVSIRQNLSLNFLVCALHYYAIKVY